jgi:hypothetical protein
MSERQNNVPKEIDKRVIFHKNITAFLLCLSIVMPLFLMLTSILLYNLTGDYCFTIVMLAGIFYYLISFTYIFISAIFVYLRYKKVMFLNIISFALFIYIGYSAVKILSIGD